MSGRLLICCSCDHNYGGDALKCGRERGAYEPCGCDCHKIEGVFEDNAILAEQFKVACERAEAWKALAFSKHLRRKNSGRDEGGKRADSIDSQRGTVMNGMQSKAARKRWAAQWTENGLPRDTSAWTIQDWADLWHAMQRAAKLISERHKEDIEARKAVK